jgi:hypothetical protein
MLRRRLDILFHNFRSRPAAWLALVGQLAALFGLPLPARSAKDLTSPFPCQHRQCGCLHAADCWNHCCCFSARERVAWAREHDAEVPESLVKQAQQSPDAKPGACCEVKQSKAHQAGKTMQRVLGLMARQCQGEHSAWGCGEPVQMPARAVTWCFEAQPATCWLPPKPDAPCVNQIPPIPPPRG